MPLQNRVTPFSAIVATPERGLFLGNRGCLHNDRRELVSSGWRTKGWVICLLEFKGRRRTPMAPRRYTELFFLDEAVALAAGHRPCAECRRASFRAFLGAWCSAGSARLPRATALDAALHPERLARRRGQIHWRMPAGHLPAGTFVEPVNTPGEAWLKYGDEFLFWTHGGYTRRERWPAERIVEVITPPSTVQALRAGYQPHFHPTAAN